MHVCLLNIIIRFAFAPCRPRVVTFLSVFPALPCICPGLFFNCLCALNKFVFVKTVVGFHENWPETTNHG